MAQGAVVGMMLMVGDNILLHIFGKPILGTYDWTGLIGTILVALAFGYCGVHRESCPGGDNGWHG